jgi:type IV pilus assembly protein PilP
MVVRIVVMLVLGASLSGCLHNMDDLTAYIQEVRARKTTKIEPIPQMKPYQAFAYVTGSRRDPFLPTAPQRESGSNVNASLRPDLNRNKEPLEEFPLDALQMVGLIDFKGKAYAMVKAPDGVVHRVSVGDHMGQNYGTITKISASEIGLTEIIPDGFGGWVERPASLALAD